MLVLWRSYTKSNTTKTLLSGKCNTILPNNEYLSRNQSNNDSNSPELINSTMLHEIGYNVTELPVVIRKLKDLSDLNGPEKEVPKRNNKSVNYHLIQEEFKQCVDLRDVFSLITKCTKITPNIALGAIERIHDLERNTKSVTYNSNENYYSNVYFAKGAILDKLLKVVMKTEDTQTILNVLKTNSSLIVPHKNKFCEELLLRVMDNKLNVDQLYEFASFLLINNDDQYYIDMIDKLWVGFTANEANVNESNIEKIFTILHGLKVSKKAMITFLEHKLIELWPKITPDCMVDIMDVFITEKYFSVQSYGVLAKWFYSNIHALHEDAFLDIITKFILLNYTDDQIEGGVEKYMKLKGHKIKSYILIIGILNYLVKFQLRNEQILNICCDHYLKNLNNIPVSFLNSFIHPFGFLYFKPANQRLWDITETILLESYKKVNIQDLCSIMLSYIYVREYPTRLVTKVLHSEYFTKISSSHLLQKLYLIDTALSVECIEYGGPLLPKDQGLKPVLQDQRICSLINRVKQVVFDIFGQNRVSFAVFIPNLCSDANFIIDIMIHPIGLGSETFNWKLKTVKNQNIALLIHLPDHYCTKSEQLIGPQEMKKRHLNLLGFKVVSLKYILLCQLSMSYKHKELEKYMLDSIGL
ncbi:FAST kinase domain-containing protein 3, mitochondrial-like [Pieris napi]|uniref:FAST kinase domain-containing protein 3, mitochondrial-like n=1 Tax=Pieris napi TaxID=78633 RepID=UPI001FB9BA50|nr:FAST kinase domain-containing protein 3, mitochondrial-like [Pieris napi]